MDRPLPTEAQGFARFRDRGPGGAPYFPAGRSPRVLADCGDGSSGGVGTIDVKAFRISKKVEVPDRSRTRVRPGISFCVAGRIDLEAEDDEYRLVARRLHMETPVPLAFSRWGAGGLDLESPRAPQG